MDWPNGRLGPLLAADDLRGLIQANLSNGVLRFAATTFFDHAAALTITGAHKGFPQSIELWVENCRKGQQHKSKHLRPAYLIPAREPPLGLVNAIRIMFSCALHPVS